MPRSKKVSSRLKPELWISMLSLLLSVMTMLLGLYLNNRSENFQKQLLELRNKADLANITLSYERGILSAYNLGPATAQDLRLVICLSSVSDQWKNSIDDVSDIEVSVVNPAVENSTQVKRGVCQSELTNNDASQITVKSLPPQQSVEIRINQSADIPVNSALMTANIYLQTSETKLISSSIESAVLSPSLDIALDKYLANNEFEIVDIEISMACKNCNLDRRQFTLSSFTKNDINQIETTRSANDIKAHINASSHYFLPKSVSQDLRKDLYFMADYDSNGDIRIAKSAKFEFVLPTSTPFPVNEKMSCPLYVYQDWSADAKFVPEGFIGDISDISLDDNFSLDANRPNVIKITYVPRGNNSWAGVYWWVPGTNLGNGNDGNDASLDISCASKLTFWARGENGNEKAEFKVGGINGTYSDSLQPASSTGTITLTVEWHQYTIDLTGKDLRHIMGGFVWVTSKPSNPNGATIYLDDIRFEQ